MDWFYADYYEELKKIEEVVGKENVQVRIFEKNQLININIYDDFIYCLGVELNNDFIKEQNAVNVSLKNSYRDIRNICNEVMNDKYSESVNEKFFLTFVRLSEEDSTLEKSNLLSLEEKNNLIKKYAKSNFLTAQYFLNRKDGKLFWEEPLKDFEEKNEVGNLDLESTIKVFTRLIVESYIEIENLKGKLEKSNYEKTENDKYFVDNFCDKVNDNKKFSYLFHMTVKN